MQRVPPGIGLFPDLAPETAISWDVLFLLEIEYGLYGLGNPYRLYHKQFIQIVIWRTNSYADLLEGCAMPAWPERVCAAAGILQSLGVATCEGGHVCKS